MTIAIIGGSGGLGEAVVRRVAARAPVVIGYRSNRAKATALVETVRAAGGKACALPVDITVSDSVQEFFAAAARDAGAVTHIISATGPQIPLAPLLEVSEADFRRIMDTDVLGTFNVLRHGIPVLRIAGGGSITVFVTTAVLRTLENDGMSSVPKTAVAGLVRLAAREAGPQNVRCNAIAPGVIDAGIVHSAFTVSEVAKQVIAACLDRTPMPRLGKPEEVAALADFLCSDAAAYINGQVIGIDGGYSA
jgi:NAD(P)-dependent dehydrogenase (short-subunit alcohol dehydrogenase family)